MGYQAYPEPTMDERYLETIPEVESLYSRRSSVAVTALPELPFRPVPPMAERESVYSIDQDSVSPNISDFNPPQPSTQPRHHHDASQASVSPLSSQTSFHPNGSDASLVSPIEPSFPTPTQPDKSLKSQIPRKLPVPVSQNTPEEGIKKRWNLRKEGNEETRWDEYSGEPSQAGKPSSVRPGATPSSLEGPYPQLKERTRQILAGLKDREAVKKSTWAKSPLPDPADPLDNPIQRPPWRGASGRHAIVEPVKNTPEARTRPLMLVERHKAPEKLTRSETPENTIPPEKTAMSPIDSLSVAASQLPNLKSVSSEDSLKPVAPLKTRKVPEVLTPQALSPKQLEYTRLLDSPFQSPGPRPPFIEPAQSPAPSTVQEYGADSPTLGSNTPSFIGPDRSPSEESFDPTVQRNPLHREPDTSSSWNTYATSTMEDNSYIPSSPIAREELTSSPVPIVHLPPAAVPEPIVLRKRVAANNSGHRSYDNYSSISPFSNISGRKSSNILRKAVGNDANANDRNGKPRAVSLMSTISATKCLPPTPIELQAADKITSLTARLEDLARRKRNLNKIIRELQESLKKNAIIYDSRKRKEVDKMITNLNLEIQDVTNEEHEVQLKLHRAQKRRDKDDFYEQPTGLWIKRVTS
ncbi:uncharacterized protein A1O5_09465 [Cladophialophora psammophila CBS 110553]|uniref:Uncharacterized protein n=1 Tax=Cladophialophora psammophila CBS 110553 TaxID=1182543 RepID=W9WH52_9EURO|nr:uncharacterized protein A1O5_09465 [Cladophialophora psammophila CBS 110553]EXJ67452.1 hypothetical protein A1O5_09465 [Cladophialophora psammophila CBS 110553]